MASKNERAAQPIRMVIVDVDGTLVTQWLRWHGSWHWSGGKASLSVWLKHRSFAGNKRGVVIYGQEKSSGPIGGCSCGSGG
jgi:hypothetical protein